MSGTNWLGYNGPGDGVTLSDDDNWDNDAPVEGSDPYLDCGANGYPSTTDFSGWGVAFKSLGVNGTNGGLWVAAMQDDAYVQIFDDSWNGTGTNLTLEIDGAGSNFASFAGSAIFDATAFGGYGYVSNSGTIDGPTSWVSNGGGNALDLANSGTVEGLATLHLSAFASLISNNGNTGTFAGGIKVVGPPDIYDIIAINAGYANADITNAVKGNVGRLRLLGIDDGTAGAGREDCIPGCLFNAEDCLVTSYLLHDEARTLAAGLMSLPGIAAVVALSDDAMDAVLLTASVDLDVAMRYQGRKYDPLQDLEFPRIDASPAARQYPPAPPSLNDPSFYVFGGSPTFIWDWDSAACNGQGAAVVPPKVKMACLHQAAWLQRPEFAERIEAIRSGLAAQSIGTGSETFIRSGDVAGGFTNLGARALQIMQTYRIRTGRML